MAASRRFVVPLILLVVAAAMVEAADDDTTHLHFFMHDIVSGSNPTSVQVIKGPGSTPTAPSPGMSFGDTSVIDDLLTETSSATSSPVGRMQGVYILSSQSAPALMVAANILLTGGDYNGSTLAVMGRDDIAADVRELAVIGGTGKFRMATGYVLWKTAAMKAPDATIELDVYLGGANGTAAGGDGSAPGSDGGSSGGSGGSSGGSKSSSGAAMTTTVSAAGWALAVAAAVVGSCWVW